MILFHISVHLLQSVTEKSEEGQSGLNVAILFLACLQDVKDVELYDLL